MKKLLLFVAVIVMVSFTSCNFTGKKAPADQKDSTTVVSDSVSSDSIVVDSIK